MEDANLDNSPLSPDTEAILLLCGRFGNEPVSYTHLDVYKRQVMVQRGPLIRESLALQTMRFANPAERLAWLADHIAELPGSGIVYTLTTRDADRVAYWLRENVIAAESRCV